jgi:hypothetical protein
MDPLGGNDFALFQNNDSGELSMSQTFDVPTAGSYLFTANGTGDGIGTNILEVTLRGNNCVTIGPFNINASAHCGGVYQYNDLQQTFSLSAGSTTLKFDMIDGAGAVGFDNISLTPETTAPEIDGETAAVPIAITVLGYALFVDRRKISRRS